MKTQDKRIVEIFKDREWNRIYFADLKKGDKFRLFESTGEKVIDNMGHSVWIAGNDAYMNYDGIWTIKILKE